MTPIVWAARRLQDLITAVFEGLPFEALFKGVGYVIGAAGLVAVFVGPPLAVLYFLVRFIKWAWAD